MNISLFHPVSLGPYDTIKKAKSGQNTITQRRLLAIELKQWVKFLQIIRLTKTLLLLKFRNIIFKYPLE